MKILGKLVPVKLTKDVRNNDVLIDVKRKLINLSSQGVTNFEASLLELIFDV